MTNSKWFSNADDDVIGELMRRVAQVEAHATDLERKIANFDSPQPISRVDPITYKNPYEGQRAIDPEDEQHMWYSDGKWRKAGGTAIYAIELFEIAETVIAGDGRFEWEIPEDLDNSVLVKVEIYVTTAGGSITQVQLNNETAAVDMLSTRVQVDAGDLNSKDSGTAYVISNGDVSWGDHIRVDIDAAGSGATGLGIICYFAPALAASIVLAGTQGDPGAPGGITAFTGEWTTATNYTAQQSVSYNGSSYAARDNHTSGSTSEPGIGANWEDHWQLLAAGSTEGLVTDVTQTAHGLSVGDVVIFDGTDYVLAQADSEANADVVGIVSSVTDANNFSLAVGGEISGLSGLTAGTLYYLSPGTAGALTATEPVLSGQISKPILIATSATTGYFYNQRGLEVTEMVDTFLAARVRHSTTQSIANTTWTSLTFDTETRDDGSMHSTSSNAERLTIPTTGWYDVKGQVQFAANTTGARGIRIRLNGSTVIAQTYLAQAPQASDALQIPVEDNYYFTAGDYVELQVYQASGGALNAAGGEGTTLFSASWSGQWISGTSSMGEGIAAGARVRRTTTQSISNNVETAVSFDAERYDTHSFHDNSTNPTRFTIPSGMGGKYSIGGTAQFESLTAALAGIAIKLNGTTFIAYDATGATTTTFMDINAEYDLAVGDYVELFVYQNSGASKNIQTVSAYTPEFWLSRIFGGGSSTNVFHGCRVVNSTTQSISNSTDTKVTFDSEDIDTDGFHSTSSNTSRITIPAGLGGYYELIAKVNYANNATGQRSTRLFKNGSGIASGEGIDDPGDASIPISQYVSMIVYLLAGDYVEVNSYQTSGGSLNIGSSGGGWSRNSFSAHRLGG